MPLAICCVLGMTMEVSAKTNFCLLQNFADINYELRPSSICSLVWYWREGSRFGRHFLYYNPNVTTDEIRAVFQPMNTRPGFEDISLPNSPVVGGESSETPQLQPQTFHRRVLWATTEATPFRVTGISPKELVRWVKGRNP